MYKIVIFILLMFTHLSADVFSLVSFAGKTYPIPFIRYKPHDHNAKDYETYFEQIVKLYKRDRDREMPEVMHQPFHCPWGTVAWQMLGFGTFIPKDRPTDVSKKQPIFVAMKRPYEKPASVELSTKTDDRLSTAGAGTDNSISSASDGTDNWKIADAVGSPGLELFPETSRKRIAGAGGGPSLELSSEVKIISDSDHSLDIFEGIDNNSHTERQLLKKLLGDKPRDIHGTIFIYSEGSPCQTINREHLFPCVEYYAILSEIFPNITFKIFFKAMRIDPAGINAGRQLNLVNFISKYLQEERKVEREIQAEIEAATIEGRVPPPPFAKITENYFRLVPKVKYKRLETSYSSGTLDRVAGGAAVKAASKMSEEQEEMDLEFNSQAYNKQGTKQQWKKSALSENKREFIGLINKWVSGIEDILINLNIKTLLFNSAYSCERVEYHVIGK